jgi:hypothetical protein
MQSIINVNTYKITDASKARYFPTTRISILKDMYARHLIIIMIRLTAYCDDLQ